MASVVILVGAGGTVADVSHLSRKKRPPLDKGFFNSVHAARDDVTSQMSIHAVQRYMLNYYGVDIFDSKVDSLERVLARIYTDVFNPVLEYEAARTFRTLIYLFNRRLALTTNRIHPTNKSRLYRIICKLLREGVPPENLSFVTFNYDLQIERTLDAIQHTTTWRRYGPLFVFPGSYGLELPKDTVTQPPETVEKFEIRYDIQPKVKVLKLHGSLNWYSAHLSRHPSVRAMLNPKRKLWVTPRKTIAPQMKLSLGRTEYTLPLVVPPVMHKASILHKRLLPIWQKAEELFTNASRVIIFGYSCPETDYESSNLIERSLRGGNKDLVIIDPNPDVLTRYVKLIRPARCAYYPDAKEYLVS